MNNALPYLKARREKIMSRFHPRMQRERQTVAVMIALYCQDHHQTGCDLGGDCRKLLEYAQLRLEKCPFQENKTTCGNCPIHCYKPRMREKIRAVMRYAGPRMLWRQPLLAVWHMIYGLRKTPGPKKRVSAAKSK